MSSCAEAVANRVSGGLDFGGGVGRRRWRRRRRSGGPTTPAEEGVGARAGAVTTSEIGGDLAVAGDAGGVLDEVRQLLAEIAEAVAILGVAVWLAEDRARPIASVRETTTLAPRSSGSGSRGAVAARRSRSGSPGGSVFSGVEGSGVRVIVSVVDWPGLQRSPG